MVFFPRTDAGPPAGGISNPHPQPQYAGAGVGPPTGEISDPHPHPSGLKSADTRIRGWNCHPYPCASRRPITKGRARGRTWPQVQSMLLVLNTNTALSGLELALCCYNLQGGKKRLHVACHGLVGPERSKIVCFLVSSFFPLVMTVLIVRVAG